MQVFRVPVLLVALMAASGCVFYPTGSGYRYEEVHHYHDNEAYYVPAPAKPADRLPLGYGEAQERPAETEPESSSRPCEDERDPWEDTPCEKAPAKLIFEEDFEGGLGKWKTCAPRSQGMSWKVTGRGHKDRAAVLNDEDDRIPGGSRLGTSWMVSKKTIDLRRAKHPKLRIHLKGGDGASAVQFRLVWAVAGGDYAEERPIGGPIAADRDWTLEEVDLSALRKTQGQLMVVAKVDQPDGDFDGPMIDSLAIYDEQD